MTATDITPESILSSIPKGHRSELIKVFKNIAKNFREGRWEPSELNGGKFCEVVYSILNGQTSGKYSPKPIKPRNMVDACRKLENTDKNKFCRSVRIQIPRMLISLYEIRSNRGVGHVGGDVDANHMDAFAVLNMTKWVMAELIRVFHTVDIDIASALVEKLIDRTIPIVWKVDGKKRILLTNLSYKDKMLLLMYDSNAKLSESDLVSWLEHSNSTVFRRDVIKPLHKDKLIEYNQEEKTVEISPIGVEYVEKNLPLEISRL